MRQLGLGNPITEISFTFCTSGEELENYLQRRAQGATSRREKLEGKMNKAKKKGQGNRWSRKLTVARLDEQQAQKLALDVSILCEWLRKDILALAGPDWHSRSELWNFIVAELQQREALCLHRIRPFRRALENQKEDLLAFVAVLDDKRAGDLSTVSNSPISCASGQVFFKDTIPNRHPIGQLGISFITKLVLNFIFWWKLSNKR